MARGGGLSSGLGWDPPPRGEEGTGRDGAGRGGRGVGGETGGEAWGSRPGVRVPGWGWDGGGPVR